jgi:lysophospholipase L1-like esterase
VKRLRYYLPRLLLSGLVFASVLALPEVAARLAYRARHGEWPVSLATAAARSRTEVRALFVEHSILPFVLRRGARLKFMDTEVEVNSNGFRGGELRTTTPLRILVVGGSTTFDTGVRDNWMAWPHRLEEELGRVLAGTEVINAGVPVYMLWTNYLKYVLYDRYVKPDIVLIYQGFNDTLPWWPTAYDELLRTDYWLFRGAEARSWSGLQGERKLAQDPLLPGIFARSVFLRGAYNERGANENVFANMRRARSVDECMPDAFLERNVDVLGYFVDAIRADGAVPILVPQSIGSARRKRVFGEDFGVFVAGLRKLNARYSRYARAAGVKLIDIAGVADAWGDERFKDLLHFNDLGSQELAALVARELRTDERIVRLHASHRDRTAMPTRVFEKDVPVDAAPELPQVQEIVLSLVSPAVRGFGPVEGPYPQWSMMRPVRWMEGTQAEIRFKGMGAGRRFALRVHVRSPAPEQKLVALVNDVVVMEHDFSAIDQWESAVSHSFTLTPENRLAFRAAHSLSAEGRELSVLFDEIAVAVE